MATAKQTAQLTALGFLQTDAMAQFPWQQTPCRHCPGAASHSLFAQWGDGFAKPRFWCQKAAGEVAYEWQPQRDRPVVRSMADVRALPRWMATAGKRPAKHVSKAGVTQFFTFSHPDPSKCGRFESPDTTPESFVRLGGACISHVTTKGETKKRHPTIGWGSYQAVRELGFPENEISLCFAFDDCPPMVLVDLDMPENLAGEAAIHATAAREQLMASLEALGCPTAPSSNPERRRAALLVSDPDSYSGRKQVWAHRTGIVVELYVPSSLTHAKPYTLDGDLPTIESSTLAELLTSQSFELPESKREAGGGGGGKKRAKVDYFACGESWARGLTDTWAFDAYNGGFHQWLGDHWHSWTNIADTEDRLWEQLQRLTADPDHRTDLQGNRGEVLRGVRAALRRDLPLVKGDTLAVKNGIIDLPTGELRAFDPAVDTHRAVTGGAYQWGWSDGECLGVLMMRYSPGGVGLLDTEGVQTLIHFVALAISGRAQRHTPLLSLWGGSGSGKGGTISLLKAALGGRAMGSTLGALQESGVLDPVWARILVDDVLMVLISEAEALEKAAILAALGDNPMMKRHLYGATIEGVPRCMFVVAGVDPPSIDLAAGFQRRTGVVKFPEHADDDPIPADAKSDPTQEQADALVTLAVRRAADVFATGYQVTRGRPEDLAEFRAAVDPLHSWLQEQHQRGCLEGRTIKGLCEMFAEGEGRRSLPPKVMTNRLKSIGYATTRGSWRDAAGKTVNGNFAHHRDTMPDLHMDSWVHEERNVRAPLMAFGVN